MRTIDFSKPSLALALAAILFLSGGAHATGQNVPNQSDPDASKSHAGHNTPAEISLADQLSALQTKVAALEAALKQNHQATASPSDAGGTGMQMGSMSNKPMGMGMMSGKGGQSMAGMNSGGQGMGGMNSGGQGMRGMGMGMMSGMGDMNMGGASGQGMGGMGMDGMKMMGGGMEMMGRMQGMSSMQMTTTLPGFPGASHIYHVGSTNFFLDHPQHISLSQEQQTKLNQIKKQSLLDQATIDRWIDAGEQELWVLTSADAPNATEIKAKVREIEKLRGDKRISFIQAVGEAARVLTDEQRQVLVGQLPVQHTVDQP